MRNLIFLIFCSAVFCLVAPMVAADDQRISVVVGGYQFEPFVEEKGGVSRAFTEFLNESQDQYQFQFLEIPARRRYDLMGEGKLDIILFEMMVWGWEDMADTVAVTKPLLNGSEVFIARQPTGKAVTDLFSNLKAKKMALTLGYHYGFADFKADPAYLRANFDVIFSEYQRFNMRHVLAGTADLAVVNDAFLERAFARDENLRRQIVVSPKADQHYHLPVMVRKDGAIAPADMTALLHQLMASGALKAFFEQENMGRFLAWE